MTIADLTREDLKGWAGDRIVRRGRSYTRDAKYLRVAAVGARVAWAHGGDRYAATVRMLRVLNALEGRRAPIVGG